MSWLSALRDWLQLSDSTSEVGSEVRWSGPPADVDEFVGRLERVGLSSYTEELVKLIRPSVRLVPAPDEGRIGGSRLGGEPDLPADTEWPQGHDGPLSFVAQVNLGDVMSLVLDEGLPSSGLLSFFYDTVSMPWGFDPKDRGSWAVIHSAADDELVRQPPPDALTSEGRYKAMALDAVRELSFPAAESHDVRELGIAGPDLWETYSSVLGPGDETVNRLLGNPEPVQGDMQEECQLASNGIYSGDGKYLDDSRAQALVKESSRWRLLLQVDSVDEADMMWGDVGRIYFWMTDEELRAHNWKDTWLVLQCH